MTVRRLLPVLIILSAAVIGMGWYAIHLTHQAEQFSEQPGDLRPAVPTTGRTMETVHLYIADDRTGGLQEKQATIALPSGATARIEEILRTLVQNYLDPASTHPLGTGAGIDDVFLLEPDAIVINVNSAFADHHRSGVLVEQLTLASLARTIQANMPIIHRMKILVDGKERETLAGHVDLLEFYSTSPADWPLPQ